MDVVIAPMWWNADTLIAINRRSEVEAVEVAERVGLRSRPNRDIGAGLYILKSGPRVVTGIFMVFPCISRILIDEWLKGF